VVGDIHAFLGDAVAAREQPVRGELFQCAARAGLRVWRAFPDGNSSISARPSAAPRR
jgi:hypothetical protein